MWQKGSELSIRPSVGSYDISTTLELLYYSTQGWRARTWTNRSYPDHWRPVFSPLERWKCCSQVQQASISQLSSMGTALILGCYWHGCRRKGWPPAPGQLEKNDKSIYLMKDLSPKDNFNRVSLTWLTGLKKIKFEKRNENLWECVLANSHRFSFLFSFFSQVF